MRSRAVFGACPQWWFGLVALVCMLICSCAAPQVSPQADRAAKSPASETPPGNGEIEPRPALKSEPDEQLKESVNVDGDVHPNPKPKREWLERRMQAVVNCLEEARQAVVAAEVDGAGMEAVRPAIDALKRSESALREAQAQLIRGDVAQAVSPLDTAEAACRAAREFNQQT
ncbi:MAG: hypothetical protein ETSY1_27065 [Candidatus Entotheonella factor]|uniref:DUF4398 domain-containing protein n=1 Tax=Entotheonella factor TaxID=1429438 RepID=W4LEJ3_ENTF1|nr:MAG: hypothetical protein ETSY1_27065 [Candidatus Entotheonella factor]